ncbi:MAG: HAMP domain-containing histidine kinase, partial [Gloeobacteraceae cyanobacterium ES-bin-144]|nr:HAMP domain-containing histidine kinase [Verrucomicrobiales bacterium]
VVWLLMFVTMKQFLLKNLREILSRRSRQIAHLSAEATHPMTTAWIGAQIGSLYAPDTPETQGRFVRVTKEGRVIYQTGLPVDGSFDPAKISIPKRSEAEDFRVEKAGAQQLIIRTTVAQTVAGPMLIEVGGTTSAINDAVGHTLTLLLIAAPVLILIAVGGAYALIGRALQPVVRLTRSAEEITLQNTDATLPIIHTGDEIETLSLGLNRMIKRIHDTVEYNRRFVADASHELKTPLAILRGELEHVINRNNLSAEARETLASNLEEVERLGKIVQGLFALSRLDCGESQTESVVFDLSKVVATTTEQMCLMAEDKSIDLRCSVPKPAPICGDSSRVKQVIVNLLDNAVKYTSAGGTVDVKTFADESHAFLEVSDNGIGIPSDALSHVFDRFYRVDKARSRDVGGAGLGLSIVKSICTTHSAEIYVESVLGKGTKFRIQFPLAKAS